MEIKREIFENYNEEKLFFKEKKGINENIVRNISK